MATHWHSIFNNSLACDDSGKVWPERYDVLATNDAWKFYLIRIDQDGTNSVQMSTKAGVYGRFEVPQNYVGTAVLKAGFTSTVTSGNVVLDFDYRVVTGDDTTSLDQSGTSEAVTVTKANPSAAHERQLASVNLTSGNFVAGDTIEFYLARDGVDAADTAASATLLLFAYLQYADV